MSMEIYIFCILLLSRCTLISTMVLRRAVMKNSWTEISRTCMRDFDGVIQFYTNDGFRPCTEEICPLKGDAGPFGEECRVCCVHKRDILASGSKSSNKTNDDGASFIRIETRTLVTVISLTTILFVIVVVAFCCYVRRIKNQHLSKRVTVREQHSFIQPSLDFNKKCNVPRPDQTCQQKPTKNGGHNDDATFFVNM
ncbi:uncharacterized protein [Clytia hemisphaerica]|uniref:Cnidarian restricted protein n=1 Tax=Clytia hemisphaerica TaxID=252671 RepID=A0A7M5X1U6_9CNID|eukprot:TCONS_00006410-protein